MVNLIRRALFSISLWESEDRKGFTGKGPSKEAYLTNDQVRGGNEMKSEKGIPIGWHSNEQEKDFRAFGRNKQDEKLRGWKDLKNHWIITRMVNGRNIDDVGREDQG